MTEPLMLSRDSRAKNTPTQSHVTVGRLTSGVEYARPLGVGWRGTFGLNWQAGYLLQPAHGAHHPGIVVCHRPGLGPENRTVIGAVVAICRMTKGLNW